MKGGGGLTYHSSWAGLGQYTSAKSVCSYAWRYCGALQFLQAPMGGGPFVIFFAVGLILNFTAVGYVRYVFLLKIEKVL